MNLLNITFQELKSIKSAQILIHSKLGNKGASRSHSKGLRHSWGWWWRYARPNVGPIERLMLPLSSRKGQREGRGGGAFTLHVNFLVQPIGGDSTAGRSPNHSATAFLRAAENSNHAHQNGSVPQLRSHLLFCHCSGKKEDGKNIFQLILLSLNASHADEFYCSASIVVA